MPQLIPSVTSKICRSPFDFWLLHVYTLNTTFCKVFPFPWQCMHYISSPPPFLAGTNYSHLKSSMLEQWRVSPSLVTHPSGLMSRQRCRTRTAHVRSGGDLAKTTARCSAQWVARPGKVTSCCFREVVCCVDLLQLPSICDKITLSRFTGRPVKLDVQVSECNSDLSIIMEKNFN